jgi:iron complex outermembrane receptor protein
MIRRFLMSSAAIIAVAAAPAFAQTEAASEEPAEIIVTAQKRSERLQDIPIAISVVSGDQLTRQGALNIENAQYLVPTLNFRKSGTTINQSLYLRGVGTATFSIAGEPSVSTVLDGVVLQRAGEAFSDLVDIERIEVLRGPQGTLYGKNASAGVVSIVSKRPTDQTEGYVEGSYFGGNGDEWRLRGMLNVAITDTVRTRVTGFYGTWEGNIFNVNPAVNRRVNGYRRYGIRAVTEADLSDTVKATVILDWRQAKDNCCAEVISTQDGGPLAGVAGLALAGVRFRGDETREINQNLITRTEETSWGASLQIDAELGTHSVTSITSFRKYNNREIRDGDWIGQAVAGIPQLHDDGPQTGTAFTQELRLTSPSDQFFSYVLGAFYSNTPSQRTFTRNVISCNPAPTPAALVPCGSAGAPATQNFSGTATFGSTFDNIGLFGQGVLNFSDRFRGIVGIRYTLDNLTAFHSRTTTPNVGGIPGVNRNFDAGVFATSTPANINGDPLATNGIPFTTKTDATNLSGKAGLQFDVTDDVMLYGSWTRGYKGPAFNIFFNLNANGTNVIDPETSDAWEAGLKNSFFDGKLTLNIAGFYAKYRNFQANNPDLVAGVIITRFTNAGNVSTRGVEADFTLRPARDFNISGGVAYTDAKVDAFRAAPGATAIVPAGTPLAFAPKWKAALGMDYRWRTGGDIDVTIGVQGTTQSSQLSLFDPSAAVRAQGLIEGYSLVNAQIGLVEKEDKFRLTLFVNNLFDQSFPAQITNGGPGGSLRYIIPREADRYFGITGRVNF